MSVAVASLYKPEFDYRYIPTGPTKTIMIATIPRSGSTFLCTELWKRGAFGAPNEYLNFLNRAHDMVPRLGSGNILRYWDRLKTVRTSHNGVFSYKTFPQDFEQIEANCPELMADISADYVVYLHRRDKLRQAISYSRAHQTNSWFAGAPEKEPAVYNRGAIRTAMRWIEQLEGRWTSLFDNTGCRPLSLVYEDVIEDIDSAVLKIARFCDINVDEFRDVRLPEMIKQSDEITADWLQRYNTER